MFDFESEIVQAWYAFSRVLWVVAGNRPLLRLPIWQYGDRRREWVLVAAGRSSGFSLSVMFGNRPRDDRIKEMRVTRTSPR